MKIAGIVIGVLLMILGVIVAIVCMLLPSMTSNKVSMDEAALGLIPAALLLILGFFVAVIAGIFFIKGRKKTAP